MKLRNKLITIILSVVFANTNAQEEMPLYDTVKINLDETLIVTILANNPEKLMNDSSFTSIVLKLQNSLKKINSIPAYDNYRILFENGKNLTIEQGNQAEKYLVENEEVQKDEFINECIITGKKYYVSIKFKELTDFFVNDIQSLINTTLRSLDKEPKFAYSKEFSFDKNGKSSTDIITNYDKPITRLMIYTGVGVNFVKNNSLTDVSAEIGWYIPRKTILKSFIYTSFNAMLYFNNDKPETYGFVNIGAKFNWSNRKYENNWFGIETGYLVKNDGDYFDKNTLKIGINFSIHTMISISPVFYFSLDDENTVYPSLRIGVRI